jgi:FkbM family methyltransferase
MTSPFFYFNSQFDAQETICHHAVASLQPTPGYLTNYLGVRIDPKFLPHILTERAGTVEAIPIPANWHADIAEWAAVLRAVDLSRGRGKFAVVELGCGWGCWLNNSGVAARHLGLAVRLVGIEGDEGHIEFARECCATNGFSADQVELIRGIAAASGGVALFPRQQHAGENWGLKPIFDASSTEQAEAESTGSHDILSMIDLREILAREKRVDLLHVDIQGGEADLIAGCRGALREHVSYIVVGTHSREIEGRLFELLIADGWTLEIERPAILDLHSGKPVVTVDGVQGWRNAAITAHVA